jgi:hypothetical protein
MESVGRRSVTPPALEVISQTYSFIGAGDRDHDDRVRLNDLLSMLKLWHDLKASRSFCLLRARSPSDSVSAAVRLFALLTENRAGTWFSGGHSVFNSGVSCFAVVSFLWPSAVFFEMLSGADRCHSKDAEDHRDEKNYDSDSLHRRQAFCA